MKKTLSTPEFRTVTCDCGTVHRVPREWVGTCDWWLCEACVDAKHREFVNAHHEMIYGRPDGGWGSDVVGGL